MCYRSLKGVGVQRWAAWSNIELKGFHQTVERELLDGRDQSWRRVAKNGDSSFFGVGVPMLQGEGSFTDQELKDSALATLGWWHHSIENRQDKLDWEWMQVHIRIYAAYLWELCTAPVLPFTYRPVAEQIIGRLKELQSDGKTIDLDGAISRANDFARQRQSSMNLPAPRFLERYASPAFKVGVRPPQSAGCGACSTAGKPTS
jgi:hypothetical protein